MKVLRLAKLSLVLLALLTGLLPPDAFAQQQAAPTKEAAKAFSEGVDAFDKGDYKTAFDQFTTAIKLDPSYSDAYYRRALVREEIAWLKQELGRERDYTEAIKLNPANADALFRRGKILKGKAAIEDFDKAISLRPDFAEAYYHRASARSESMYWLRRIQSGGLKEQDLGIYSKQIGTESKKMAEVIVYLTNEIRAAIPDVTKSTELNPKYVEAYLYLASLYSALGEHDNAVAASTRALAIKPDNADAFYARGLAYLHLKQYEKANQDFTEVIRLRPEQTNGYTKRVVARFHLEDFDGALKDYVTVLRSKPNDLSRRDYYEDEMSAKTLTIEPENFDQVSGKLATPVRSSLADAYYQRALTIRYSWRPSVESQKKAVADLNRANMLQPAHVAAHHEKGLTLSNLELHAAAVKAFSEVIRLQPQNPEALYARGVALHELKLNRRALRDLSRSIQLSPKFTKAYYERARVYAALGDPRKAVADFTTAITLHSEFGDAYYRRAQAYETLGVNRKAVADYIRVARLAYPDEKTEGDQTERLGPRLATVFHRGVARLCLALQIDNNDGYGFRSRAEEFGKKDYLESAEKDFTHVINAKPEFPNAYRERGRARATQRINKYFGGKGANYSDRIEAALADFTKAIELNPRYIDAYFSRADHFDSAYKPEDAIRDYKRIVELDPANALAFYRLARNYERNTDTKPADLKAALENYSLAIKTDPGYVRAYFSRASLLEEEEPQRALADYTKIIQLDPENAGAYRRRAAIYQELKDYRNASADYTRAIELDPSEPGSDDWDAAHTFADRAHVRFELGDGKGAVEDYQQALLIRPCLYCTSGSSSVSQANKADAFLQKGLALLRRGDKEASRKNLEEAARLFYTQGDMPKYQSVKYHLSRF